MKLKARLEKINTNGGHLSTFNLFHRQLKWPFSTSETKSLLEALERHKCTALLALNAGNLASIEKLLSAQEKVAEGARDLKTVIEQRRAFEMKFESFFSEKDRRDVLRFFGKSNPTKRHQTSKSLRHPNTGLWLLEDDELQDWLSQGSNKLWLSGIPGAGKTVLASALIEEAAKCCENFENEIAYFYCDYKDEQNQDPVNILGSLAVQLAQQSIESFELLRDLYHHHYRQKMGQPYAIEICSLVETIRQICTAFGYVFIIVDALDECGKYMSEVTRVLADLSTAERCHNLKVALLSREEQEIANLLTQEFAHIRIAARSGDLSLFVVEEMDKRMKEGTLEINSFELKKTVKEQLIAKADGM